MKPVNYICALCIALTACTTILATNNANDYKVMSTNNEALKSQLSGMTLKIDIISKQNAEYQKQINNMTWR
jgi:hypothetical protein